MVQIRHDKPFDTHPPETLPITNEQFPPQEQPPVSQASQPLSVAQSPDRPSLPAIQSGPEQVEPTGQLPPGMPSSPPAPVPSFPSTPTTVKRTKQDLPVFTSTSPIAFGSKASALPSGGIDSLVAEDHESAIKTDESLTKNGILPMQNSPVSSQHGIVRGGQEQLDRQLQSGHESGGGSIWDVPETPQPKRT